MKRKKIIVAPESEFHARRRLFGLLAELYPVDFEPWQPNGTSAFDGAIYWEGCAAEKAITSIPNLDCLVFARPGGPLLPLQKRQVRFEPTASLDKCFRGQTMNEECIEEFPALRPHDRDEIICWVDSLPYWLLRRTGNATADIVALGPEELPEGQTVYDHFNRRRWLRLLPVFHFLKQLTRAEGWEPPPLRACLMFDDPNLHWPTYGFLDLRKLAQHAQQNNYHVSCAMVPLDSWFINSQVSALFREHRPQLSLCMHGNDHAHAELASPLDAGTYAKLLAQGLLRIERFEKRSGVPVSRVMVPPYGALQENVAGPMLKLGYEAACVSRASLTAWNKKKIWPAAFGHPVSEFIGAGLPVIPRHMLGSGYEGSYRLAAFLNQPIIPHGHHEDCANGLDLLADAANSINRLGQVIWSDMSTISRSNYLTRRVNGTLMVKMLARRITLPVNEDIKEIIVERPWIGDDGKNELLFGQEGNQTHFAGMFGWQSAAIPLPCNKSVELISTPEDAVDYRKIAPPQFQFWPRTRRVFCEVRDRLTPLAASLRSQRVPSKSSGAVLAETKQQVKKNFNHREGRKARLLGPLLFRLYGSTRSEFVRSKIRSLVLKLEGDEYYSLTIREIFSKYHHREVGLFSAGASLLLEAFSSGAPGVSIGRYTSLTPSVKGFNANHPLDWKSTHAFFYNPAFGYVKRDLLERTKLTIGNDVWIGHNVTLLPSVSMIGDGAVIAAGSVVFQNVPPYAIVGGWPARLIRYRFSREAIEKLRASKWWEKSIDELKNEFGNFQKPWEMAPAELHGGNTTSERLGFGVADAVLKS